jgi:myo-inositol-1(or 4)-monophosphatase
MSKPFVALLLATDTELSAAHELATQNFQGHVYPGPNEFIVELGLVFVVVRRIPAMGNLDATATARDVIQTYRPAAMIGAGICAGIEITDPRRRRNICDIIVGDSIIYYEPAKIFEGDEEWRPPEFRTTMPEALVARVSIPEEVLFSRAVPRNEPRPQPRIHRGIYCSGENVVADQKFVDSLITKVGKFFGIAPTGIDMESAGIANGCSKSRTKFLIVKAISDFATRSKGDRWQKCAATISIAAALNWAKSLTSEDLDLLVTPSVDGLPIDALSRAEEVALLVGGMLPPRGVSVTQVEERAQDDQITRFDRISETTLKEALCVTGERFIGEEDPLTTLEAVGLSMQPTWVVDPIDGTQNLVAGRPEVAISIALYEEGDPSIGVIHFPYRSLTIRRSFGRPIEVNGIAWTPRRKKPLRLHEAVVALPGDLRRLRGLGTDDVVAKLLSHVAGIRVSGALAYDLACIALGEIDARISTSVKFVDVAAAVFLLEGAGGRVSAGDGSEWTPNSTTIVAAATPQLHADLLAIVQPWFESRKLAGAEAEHSPDALLRPAED